MRARVCRRCSRCQRDAGPVLTESSAPPQLHLRRARAPSRPAASPSWRRGPPIARKSPPPRSSCSPPSTSASNPEQVGQIPADYKQGSGTIVSGTTATKATEAAPAAYPGGVVDRMVARMTSSGRTTRPPSATSRCTWSMNGAHPCTVSSPTGTLSAHTSQSRHASSGWGEAPLVVGADDLEVLVDEDVVGPVDADVVDLVIAVAQRHHTVDDAARVSGQRRFGRLGGGCSADDGA